MLATEQLCPGQTWLALALTLLLVGLSNKTKTKIINLCIEFQTIQVKQKKHTEDIDLFECFEMPLEAAFATFELVLDDGPMVIVFVDSNDSEKS